MACGLGVIKAILCTVNVTIALLGVAAIVVGAIVLNNRNLHDVNDHLEQFSNYPTAATVALVAGVTVLLFGFCGCCGACFGVGWILLMVRQYNSPLFGKHACPHSMQEAFSNTLVRDHVFAFRFCL